MGLCHPFGYPGRPLFVFLQRRNFHQCAFGVGEIDGVAVVSQCLLAEPFRVAELLPAVPGAGRTSQAAGQARAERPQVVCDR